MNMSTVSTNAHYIKAPIGCLFLLSKGVENMAETSQMVRSYLKNLGYKDEDVTYQSGANGQPGTVNLQGKNFMQGTPGADGYIRAGQSGLDSAMNQFKGNQAMGQTNDLLKQYQDRITQPTQPFTYDVNAIKADPRYQSQLSSFTADQNRGTNQSLVNLGRRGIGNSQSGVVAEVAGQKNITNYANNDLLPQMIAKKYQEYADQINQQNTQNKNMLGLAGVYNDQNKELYGRGRDAVGDQRYNSETAYQQDQNQQNRDYQTTRDSIMDERYKTEYDEDVKRYGLEFAQKKAMENGQLRISQQNANTSSRSTSNSAANTKIDNLMNTFKTTGIAPAGLESVGINQGDRLPVEESSTKPVKMDAKESVDNVQGAKEQVKGKGIQEALQYAMNTKEYYTDADYKALIMYINKNNF